MSISWAFDNIGNVCKTGAGGTPIKSKKEYYDGGSIPWLRSGEVCTKNILKAEKHITASGLKGSSAKLFPPNTVLVAMYGATAGQVGILRFECSTNQAVCGILPNDKVTPEFLYYSLLSQTQELVSQAAGNAQPNISQEKIKNTTIPLPPLEEQKAIVKILDETFAAIDKAIENTEKNLANARELFENELNAVLDSNYSNAKSYTFTEFCSITSSLVDPKEVQFQHMLHIGAGNMITASDELVNLKTAEEEGLISGKFVFDNSMVLYSKIRPYLRKVVAPDFSGLCSADIYPLKPDTEIILKEYLHQILLSHRFTEYAILGSNRAGMPKVNRNHLFAYKVTLPDIETQKELVKKISTIKNLTVSMEKLLETKRDALKELKQAILHKAFTGELTANNKKKKKVA